jgi:ATP-dependent DNA helicase RecG
VVTLWRDWLTDQVLAAFHLNERQVQAVRHAKVAGRITNAQYRELTGISDSTALRELRLLTRIGVFDRVGGTGQAIYYVIARPKSTGDNEAGNPS